jgi:hypothetical protein
MSISISEQSLFPVRRDKQTVISTISGGGSIGNVPSGTVTAGSRTVIPFTADTTPGIDDYQATYASVFGEHPVVVLKTIDSEGNYIVRNEQAKYGMVDGVLNSISWDLPDPESGYIIIS